MVQKSGHVRRNRSFLAEAEQRLMKWLLPQIPETVTSLHLTILGMIGSLAGAIALIGCNWSRLWLPTVALKMSSNSLAIRSTASLARYRKDERPRFGFLVDHTCDLFSQIMPIVAFGLSPFLSLVAALTVLLCYLLFSAYTYIRAAAHHVHQMSYIGIGAEFRILMIAWAFIGSAVGLKQPLVDGLSGLDLTNVGARGLRDY